MSWLVTLQNLPDGVSELTDLISKLDRCFLSGFASFGNSHEETLESLQRIFSGTPLQEALEKSYEALQCNNFTEGHFASIAAARTALQGSQFDILQRQIRRASGRSTIEDLEIHNSPEIETPSHINVWLESTRQWLTELALAGFGRLEAETLTPFMSTLEQIQGEPQLVRLSALLTGFLDELIAAVPISDVNEVPLYRWADLWTRAMIGALKPVPPTQTKIVSGTLRLVGFDLRQHTHFFSIAAYGLLETDSSSTSSGQAHAQFVRITMSSYKVDAISGKEVWLLFPDAAALFEAFSKKYALQISNMSLLPTGDMIWDGEVTSGKKYELMDEAERWFAPNAENMVKPCIIAPVDRHPVQLAEPIFLSGYAVKEDADKLFVDWGDNLTLPVAMDRIGMFSELTRDIVAKSSQMFGLMRFDNNQWSVQPLGVVSQTGKGKKAKTKTIFTGESASVVLKKPPKTSTIAILQERASRLLRKS